MRGHWSKRKVCPFPAPRGCPRTNGEMRALPTAALLSLLRRCEDAVDDIDQSGKLNNGQRGQVVAHWHRNDWAARVNKVRVELNRRWASQEVG